MEHRKQGSGEFPMHPLADEREAEHERLVADTRAWLTWFAEHLGGFAPDGPAEKMLRRWLALERRK